VQEIKTMTGLSGLIALWCCGGRQWVAWLVTGSGSGQLWLCNHRLAFDTWILAAIICTLTPAICLAHTLTGVWCNCDLYAAGWCNVPIIEGSTGRNERLYEREAIADRRHCAAGQRACNDWQVIDLQRERELIVVADRPHSKQSTTRTQ